VTAVAAEVRYWDRDSWAEFFRQEVLPLYESALTIARLWSELRERAHGRLLSDVLREAPSLELAFAGGTSPPDRYEEDSLALAYKELLGASVNLREYHFLKQLGKEPRTPCKVERTLPVGYADRISVLLERALTRAGELGLIAQSELQSARGSSARAAKEVLERPELISERFAEFLNRALSLTVNYSGHTKFVWHMRKISRDYMYELYPETKRPEVFRFLQQLLGMSEFVVPQIEDPEIANLYTIFSYDYAIRVTREEIDGMNIRPLIEPLLNSPACAVRGRDSCDETYTCTVIYYYFQGRFEYGMRELPYEPYNTAGGCLCRVNELVWGLFDRCSRELKLVIGNEVPSPFKEWQQAVGSPPIRTKFRSCECVYRGYGEISNPPKSYEELSILDENVPAIIVGRAELVKAREKLCLINRW
jgi:hypothetical protein